MNLIQRVTKRAKNTKIADFRTGDTVNVFVKVKEGEKERTQVYKGIVTKIQGSGVGRSFTVRKISAGVGVERTFPFVSPVVESVELLTTGNVRRGKLYYLRNLAGKAAKIESEIVNTAKSE
jgi:large subunit ribosomal protein L19